MLRLPTFYAPCPSRPVFASVLLAISLLVFQISFTQVGAVAAAPSQQVEPQPIRLALGEPFAQTLAAGGQLQMEMDAPEEGLYQIQNLAADNISADLTLILRNAAGEVLYDDVFANAELRLAAGRYLLEFSASQEAQIGLLILGQIGEMGPDASVPGRLFAGSIYEARNVEGALFASLVIPATPYAQEVTLALTPAAGESYLVSVQGADVSIVISSDEADQLRFVSRGGLYQVIVQPDSPATTFILTSQVSGPPPLLTIGQALTGVVPGNASSAAWRFEPARFYPTLTMQVASELGDQLANLEIHVEDEQGVTLYKQRYLADGAAENANQLEQITPGRYFLTLNRLGEEDADLPFELTLAGLPAPESVAIENGSEIQNEVAASATEAPIQMYRFDVEQTGALVTVSREDSAENDYVLNVGRKEGESLWRAALPAGAPMVQFVAPEAGPYFVTLLGSQGVFSYTLQVLESAPVPQLNINGLTWGEVEAGEVAFFRLQMVEAQRWVTLLLAGSNRTALDISISGYDERGKPVELRLAATPQSSTEVISLITDGPRTYEVRVENHGERQGGFFLLARVEDPAAISQQWATQATINGEFTELTQRAVGEPDATLAAAVAPASEPANTGVLTETGVLTATSALTNTGELTATGELTDTGELTATGALTSAQAITGVWSPTADEQVVALDLSFSRAVVPSQVELYIASDPAQIVSIEGYEAETNTWIVLWTGEDAAETAPGIFSPQLAQVDFSTDLLRVVIDTLLSDTAATIDAVKLMGRP